MIGIPLSGWLMISAHKTFPFKNMIWGIIEWPIIPFFRDLPVEQVEAWHHLFEVVHEALGEYMLIALLLLHVAAVVKHHVIDKDPVLQRMLPFRQRPAPE
jgi:cytochrome b561